MIKTIHTILSTIPLRIKRGGELFICALLLLCPFIADAQITDTSGTAIMPVDSTITNPATGSPVLTETSKIEKDTSATIHSVRKATLLSTFLPGAGQVYNKKAWKVPVIYAAFGSLVYLVKFNSDRFKNYENALLLRYDNDPSTIDEYQDLYTEDNLKSLRDYYRRNRDLSVVGLSLVYVLNIIDAHVDAHLFNFNVTDDLSMNWSPTFQSASGSPATGLSMHLTF